MKHRSWRAIPLLLSLALVPAAQATGTARQGAEKPAPHKQGEKIKDDKQTKSAKDKVDKADGRATLAVVLPVTGATPANAGKTLEALRGLKQASFRCESCDDTQATAGVCPQCKKPLTAGPERSRFHKAKLSEDAHQLTLTMAPGHAADLSLIEAGLAPEGVQVDRQAFAIPAYSRLVLTGGSQEKAAQLQKALTDAKLFQAVAVTFEAPTQRLYVTPQVGSAKVELGRFTEALKRADASLRLENVEWCAPCPACTQKGMLMDGCAVCCPLVKT